MKRYLMALVLCVISISAASAQNQASRLKMIRAKALSTTAERVSSDTLEIAVDDNGRFTMGIPDGPILVFGHPFSSTSYTTVRIDDSDYTNGSWSTIQSPVVQGLSIIGRWLVADNVTVKMTLQIVESQPGSGVFDTGRIEYEIRNQDVAAHTVGVRLMIDTMLGFNDGAPLRVPGVEAIETETDFVGNAVPAVWEAFDDLINPTVVAKGTLISGLTVRPDRFVAAQWGRIFNAPWDYTVNPEQQITDSAVGIYWYPVRLSPGEPRHLATYYGLGSLNLVSIGHLRAGITVPTALESDALGRRSPNPFDVNLFLQNDASTVVDTITAITARLNLPSGLSVVDGDTTRLLGDLAPDGATQTSWKVQAADEVVGTIFYSMLITASVGFKTIDMSVEVPKLEDLGALYGKVTDTDTGFPITGATVTTTFDRSVSTDDFGFYLVPRLEAGSGYTVTAFAIGHSPAVINDVAIVAGETTFVDIELPPSGDIEYRIAELSPDPNPPGLSFAMNGGETNRYYRIVEKETGRTAQVPVAVNIQPLGVVVSRPDGILQIPLQARDIGVPGQNQSYIITEIDGRSLPNAERINFSVRVLERDYQATWTSSAYGGPGFAFRNAGSGNATRLLLQGVNTNPDGSGFNHMSITRQLRGMAGLESSTSTRIGAHISDVQARDGLRGNAEGSVAVLSKDTYRFDYPPDNPASFDAATRFILLNEGLIGVLHPRLISIFSHAGRILSNIVVPLNQNTLSNQSALDDAYVRGSKALDVKFGAGAGASARVDVGDRTLIPATGFDVLVNPNVGVDGHLITQVTEYHLSQEAGVLLGLTGRVSVGTQSGINFRNRAWLNAVTAELPEMLDLFNSDGTTIFDGTIGATLEVIKNQEGVLQRLALTLLKRESVQETPPQFRQSAVTYTIESTPEQLRAIAHSIQVGRALTEYMDGDPRRFAVGANTFSTLLHNFFIRIRAFRNTVRVTYTKTSSFITEQPDTPFDIETQSVTSARVRVNMGTRFLHGKRLVTERGVWFDGRHFGLERYSDDQFTPNITRTMNDFQRTILENMSNLVYDAFSHAVQTVVDGLSTIVQTNNAKLTIPPNALNGGTQVGNLNWSFFGSSSSVTSSTLTDTLRKVSARIRTKAIQSANLRYGIGGFHQLTPEGEGLSAPAAFSITYADEEIDGFNEAELRMYANKGGDTNKWVLIGGTADPVVNTVTASIDTFWTYTLAPLIPSGSLTLQIVPDTLNAGSTDAATVTSLAIVNNDSTLAKDGTLVTVLADGGTIAATDLDPTLLGVQLATTNGLISFQLQPGDVAGIIHIEATTVYGDATGEGIVTVIDDVKPAAPQTPAFTTLNVDQFTLQWLSNSEADIAGYRIYFDTDSSGAPYDGGASIFGRPSPVDIGFDTTAALTGLDPGITYYIALTAYDLSGNESDFSSEILVRTAAVNTSVIDSLGVPLRFTFDDSTRVTVTIDSATVGQDSLSVRYFGTFRPFEFVFTGFSAPLLYFDVSASLADSAFKATVTVQYADSLLQAQGITDESHLRFALYNPDADVWTVLDGTQVLIDTVNNIATLTTNHFSLLALAVITPTGIGDTDNQPRIPKAFALNQNYPNPFNTGTRILYALPEPGHVTLKIYNILGQEIVTLVSRVQQAGVYEISWNGTNRSGMTVASGVYFYRLTAKPLSNPRNVFAEIRKMVLVK